LTLDKSPVFASQQCKHQASGSVEVHISGTVTQRSGFIYISMHISNSANNNNIINTKGTSLSLPPWSKSVCNSGEKLYAVLLGPEKAVQSAFQGTFIFRERITGDH